MKDLCKGMSKELLSLPYYILFYAKAREDTSHGVAVNYIEPVPIMKFFKEFNNSSFSDSLMPNAMGIVLEPTGKLIS